MHTNTFGGTSPRTREFETDVLILGAGAAGCGAAIAARQAGASVMLVEKGKLESSGCVGGGNDHFLAVLNSGPANDSTQALVDFFKNPLGGLTPALIERGWGAAIPEAIDLLLEIGMRFASTPDGSWLRTVGFGQPGPWWINLENGATVKRRLAAKVRSLGAQVMDHVMVTRLLTGDGRIAGCAGFNVLDGTFYVYRAKAVILALGNDATRGWTNSTGNPYNIWRSPYNTGSQFVLAFDAGARILALDHQTATLIPKGFGAPGMNGINSMGGHELNALGERFMGRYDPMWENGARVNQVGGTYQELIEGRGPPFLLDMRHLDKEEVRFLQYVLMPGDKATYLDYCEQKGIEFADAPLEVEISELSFSARVWTDDDFETDVTGLFSACVFPYFSGALCGGLSAGGRAAARIRDLAPVDDDEVLRERESLYRPLEAEGGMDYREFEAAVRQVMNYYVGYRRNHAGMQLALEKLAFLERHCAELRARDWRDLMKVNESMQLVRMCQLAVAAGVERKESGRMVYRRTDYPERNPAMNRPLVAWREGGQPAFSWELAVRRRERADVA